MLFVLYFQVNVVSPLLLNASLLLIKKSKVRGFI